jgi:hypothetical protein
MASLPPTLEAPSAPCSLQQTPIVMILTVILSGKLPSRKMRWGKRLRTRHDSRQRTTAILPLSPAGTRYIPGKPATPPSFHPFTRFEWGEISIDRAFRIFLQKVLGGWDLTLYTMEAQTIWAGPMKRERSVFRDEKGKLRLHQEFVHLSSPAPASVNRAYHRISG